MAYILTFYLAFSLAYALTIYLAFYPACSLTYVLAYISGMPPGIYSDILLAVYFFRPILSGIYPDMLSGILSDICSEILSGKLPGILSGIPSGMFSGPGPLHSFLSSRHGGRAEAHWIEYSKCSERRGEGEGGEDE